MSIAEKFIRDFIVLDKNIYTADNGKDYIFCIFKSKIFINIDGIELEDTSLYDFFIKENFINHERSFYALCYPFVLSEQKINIIDAKEPQRKDFYNLLDSKNKNLRYTPCYIGDDLDIIYHKKFNRGDGFKLDPICNELLNKFKEMYKVIDKKENLEVQLLDNKQEKQRRLKI